jgi:glycerol-3-phosphate acyltransferase PlsY
MQPNEALLHNAFYGNYYVRVVAAVLFSYLMGSIPFRQVFAWFFAGLDRRLGSTAYGFAPVMNYFKAFVPILIVAHGGGPTVGALASVAAVAGDCYCPWLRFRDGGRGAAAQLGALSGLCWPAAVVFAAVWLTIAIASNSTAIGTMLATIVGLLPLWFFIGVPGAWCAAALMVVVAGAHRANFVRLRDGIEPTMRTEADPERSPAAPSVVRLSGQPVQGFQI